MFSPPRTRLALALGDQELEWRIRPTLELDEQLEITADCLSADQLTAVVESRQVDLLLVAWGLHRLGEPLLEQLTRSGLPMLLLVPDAADERWSDRRFQALAQDAEANAVHEALLRAKRGHLVRPKPRPSREPVELKPDDRGVDPEPQVRVLAIAGGAGSPGRTTVAISLAAALGSVAPTVLVEADLTAPAFAAYIERDPSRNICTLAHAVRESPHAWTQAIADELQVLNRHVPHAAVLCGLPKREMRSSVSPGLIQRLVAELASRFRFVILDVGEQLLGTDAAVMAHRAALGVAQHVLLVSRSDMVGLWHTRVALKQLEHQLSIEPAHVSLIVNRHDSRHHHSRSEIEWHLGVPIAAVIPFDHAATERAITDQSPLVLDGSSRAARAILDLAERLHAGHIHLPRTDSRAVRPWWRRWPARQPTSAAASSSESDLEPRLAASGRREGRAW